MYKDLFSLVIAIISTPGKAMKALSEKDEREEEFLTRFVFPLIGLVTLAAFVGVLFTMEKFSTEVALKSSVKALISYFGGFYLSAYLLNEVWKNVFGREKDIKLCQRFVGYSSALMYALTILLSLFPIAEFFYLRIFLLYTFYIVWEGAMPFMRITENEQVKFVMIASTLIVALPLIIEALLFLLMPGMRV